MSPQVIKLSDNEFLIKQNKYLKKCEKFKNLILKHLAFLSTCFVLLNNVVFQTSSIIVINGKA